MGYFLLIGQHLEIESRHLSGADQIPDDVSLDAMACGIVMQLPENHHICFFESSHKPGFANRFS